MPESPQLYTVHLLCDFYAADAELPDPVLWVDHVTPPEGSVPLLDVRRVRRGPWVEHDELLAAGRLRPDEVHPSRCVLTILR